MKRVNSLILLIVIVLGFGSCTQKEAIKPNIIYIMADDLGYGDLACYGQKMINTPNIDVLAEQGMRFTQHYSGSTVCAPSRAVLMTGYHTGHTNIRGNKAVRPEGQASIPAETVTIAKLLRQAGYTTGCIGKWGLGAPGSEGDPILQGFDYFFGYNCQRHAHGYYPEYLWRNDLKLMLEENSDGNRVTYSHDLMAEDALNFIRDNKEGPFFLYLALTIPHAELAVPDDSMEPYIGEFDEVASRGYGFGPVELPYATFAGMISRMDKDVGRISKLLEETGIADNTIILFTSDNGPHKEGGANPEYFDSNGIYRGVKRDLYEGGIRVPLIAYWPGRIEKGLVSEHISAFWDFLPTACDLAGIDSPQGIDGISYLPSLLQKEQKEHKYMYWEFHEQGGKQAIRKGKWKAIRLNVKRDTGQALELYDLENDPSETMNIADQHPDIVKEMEDILIEAHIEHPDWKFINKE